MLKLYLRFKNWEEGQDLVEYAMLVGFIAIVAVVAVTAAGVSVSSIFNAIKTKIDTIPK